jgi:hypothetical protein
MTDPITTEADAAVIGMERTTQSTCNDPMALRIVGELIRIRFEQRGIRQAIEKLVNTRSK